MEIEAIAKRIYGIRKAMGYSTMEQRKAGFLGELEFIRNMIENIKPDTIHNSGGFRFQLSPSKKFVIITPDFKFRLRLPSKK